MEYRIRVAHTDEYGERAVTTYLRSTFERLEDGALRVMDHDDKFNHVYAAGIWTHVYSDAVENAS